IVRKIINGKKVIVALSGGLDSTLVAFLSNKHAKETLAVTVDMPMVSRDEIKNARTFMEELGIPLRVIEHDMLANELVSRNAPDRCYHCKKEIAAILIDLAEELDFDIVCDGSNFSDLSEDRPGLKALKEARIVSPLMEAMMTKEDIRVLSDKFSLPSRGLPSQACLASRIPFGIRLSNELINKIESAEKTIKSIIGNDKMPLRVRVHVLDPDTKVFARIETDEQNMRLLLDKPVRMKIAKALKNIGFTFITVDIDGLRSGSMSALIKGLPDSI
ncbi:MAG: ATP-dependent sacrificial sulfur transferase LarE, partial [Promethearchaeota archaeon]